MGYSPEYIIKSIVGLVLSLLTIAGLFGLPFTESEKTLVAGSVATVINGVLAVMTVITMIRQKQKEKLTVTGAYTYRTPEYLQER